MLFLINNPLILLLGLIIGGFIILIGYRIFNELNLNKLLKQKHRVMRVKSQKVKTGFKKRVSLLTSTALAPVIVVVLFVALSTNNTVTPVGGYFRCS